MVSIFENKSLRGFPDEYGQHLTKPSYRRPRHRCVSSWSRWGEFMPDDGWVTAIPDPR